jgi:hypothetical protein
VSTGGVRYWTIRDGWRKAAGTCWPKATGRSAVTPLASATMPAFVSGIFRVRFWLFVLGALVAGIGWIGMYVGLSYFLGEEVAKRIGNAGAKALLGVLVIVAIGLGLRAGYSWWRATRHRGDREQDAPKDRAPLTSDPPLSGDHRSIP